MPVALKQYWANRRKFKSRAKIRTRFYPRRKIILNPIARDILSAYNDTHIPFEPITEKIYPDEPIAVEKFYDEEFY